MPYTSTEILTSPGQHRRKRRSQEEKEALFAQIRAMKASGMTLKAIAHELGLSLATLSSWRSEFMATGAPGFRAVVTATVQPPPVLVTPSGYRVEGLDLATLAQLLRALA
jgi:transposase-like protein